jgi:hypothetical protein
MRGRFFVPPNATNREAAGVAAGAEVDADITLDTAPREVELPNDLRNALAWDTTALQFFEQLAFTHYKEWVRWITEAKRPRPAPHVLTEPSRPYEWASEATDPPRRVEGRNAAHYVRLHVAKPKCVALAVFWSALTGKPLVKVSSVAR